MRAGGNAYAHAELLHVVGLMLRVMGLGIMVLGVFLMGEFGNFREL